MRIKLLLVTGILLSAACYAQLLATVSVPQQVHAANNTPSSSEAYKSFRARWYGRRKARQAKRQIAQVKTAPKKRTQYRSAATRIEPKPRVQTLLPVVDQIDIRMHHRRIAHEVLMQFPEACRSNLKNFYVRYDPTMKHRALGGKSTVIIRGVNTKGEEIPHEEFRALLVHELGHVFDLGSNLECAGGTKVSGKSEFSDGSVAIYNDDPSLSFYRISWVEEKTRKTSARKQDFCSTYGATDVFEDFAECFTYFVLHNEIFAQRATENVVMAAKYRWFQAHFFQKGINIASTKIIWDGNVVWDITKLPYAWHPNLEVAVVK